MQSEIKQVLEQLQITKVYWIDDDNTKSADMDLDKLRDEAVAIINQQGSTPIRNVIGKMPDSWKVELGKLQKELERDEKKDEPRPDRSEYIEKKLNDLIEKTEDEPSAALKTLLESVDGRLSKKEKAALASLFQPKTGVNGHEWRTLSFTDWEKEQAAILAAHSPDKPALILLDQQNTRDKSSLDGDTILKNVCSNEAHRGSFKFFVVTNTTTIEGEFEHSVDLAKRVSLGKMGVGSPVFSVSKGRITRGINAKPGEPTLESHFVSLLRRLRLSLLNKELTDLARKAITDATDRAFSRLSEITLHEFMYAVTQSSQIEGVSELDTLLRLLTIEQRDALLSEVVRSKPLRTAIERIRDIPVEIRKTEMNKREDLMSLRGREIYWPEQAVNQLHQPVAAGDIFELGNAGGLKDYYVVLGNDCDLMLRSDGERNSVFVLMAKIEAGNGDKDLDATLECPLPQNTALVRVPMNKLLSAPMDILDLCWLNANGACVWKKADDHQALHLLKSQKKRAAVLREKLTGAASLERLVATAPFALARKPNLKTPLIDFRLRRVGRMNAPYAQGLLAKFASVFARPSYEHNYSEVRQA